MKLDINNTNLENSQVWKLTNQQAKKEIKREIRKYFEMNEDENVTY
jgi:hypothetical protein